MKKPRTAQATKPEVRADEPTRIPLLSADCMALSLLSQARECPTIVDVKALANQVQAAIVRGICQRSGVDPARCEITIQADALLIAKTK